MGHGDGDVPREPHARRAGHRSKPHGRRRCSVGSCSTRECSNIGATGFSSGIGAIARWLMLMCVGRWRRAPSCVSLRNWKSLLELHSDHSLVERRRFSIVFPPPTQGDQISPYSRFRCQRCFVYPSRGSTSSILPNMSTRTALHLQSCRRRPGGWEGGGAILRPPIEFFLSVDITMGCRPPHANGAVDEEIDSIKQFDLRNKRGYTVLYAFTARNRHHVRVARARQPAGRGHVDRAPMLASSQLRRERIADAGSSRRVAPWHLAWCLSSHVSP